MKNNFNVPVDIGIGVIEGYDAARKCYMIRRFGMVKTEPAILLMDSPQTRDGSCTMFVPTGFVNATVLYVYFNGNVYIVGFPQMVSGLVPPGGKFGDLPLTPGTRMISGNGNTHYISMAPSGQMDFVSSPQIVGMRMSANQKLIETYSYNSESTYGGGATKVFSNIKEGVNTVRVLIKKALESAKDIKAKLFVDNVEIFVGDLNAKKKDAHLIDATLSQDYVDGKAEAVTKYKLGKQEDGTWTEVDAKFGKAGEQTEFSYKADKVGKITLKDKVKTDEKSLIVTIDPENDQAAEIKIGTKNTLTIDNAKGEFSFKSTVGDGCEITITPSGDIKISTKKKDAKILIGGEGSEQQLVTKSWIEQIFDTHVHPSTAPGPPLPPTIPCAPLLASIQADAPTNFVTNTLKAE